MIPVRCSLLLTFGTALVLSALALMLTLMTLLGTSSPFVLLIAAIMLSTRFGGWGPGLFAALFATAASMYFFLPSIGTFGIVSFGLIALLLIILFSRDLTARRKSEQDALQLVAIVNSSKDSIVTKTLDGTIQTWNPSAERLFGYSADEMVGKSVQVIYPSERLDEFEKTLARLRNDACQYRAAGGPAYRGLVRGLHQVGGRDDPTILEVRDNGKGISQTPDTNRFGILGMRERTHVFGGDVMFQGTPGQGTTVTVRIPV